MIKFKVGLILTLCAVVTAVSLSFLLKKKDYSPLAAECDTKIYSILKKYSVSPVRQKQTEVRKFRAKAVSLEKEFLLPFKKNLAGLSTEISAIAVPGVKIAKVQKKTLPGEKTVTFEFYAGSLRLYLLKITQKSAAGKIAIVLDDWGYSKQPLNDVLSLNIPVTMAILPGLAYSDEIAGIMKNKKYEYILHLPLEPHNSSSLTLEKNTITTAMAPNDIFSILEADLARMPGLKGVNNHMGSKATENAQTIGSVMQILKSRNLYFLDSYTSNKSVAEKVAGEYKIPFFKRDIFLDDQNDAKAIEEQLIKAKNISREYGSVIAIGHARPLTIAVLKKMLPRMELEGYDFVFVSGIPQQKGGSGK